MATAAIIYGILLLLVFPFVYHQSYLDILQAKTTFFLWITRLFFPVFLAGLWIERKNYKSAVHGTGKLIWILRAMFAAGLFLPMILSDNRMDCWTGINAKMMGVRILLLCLVMSLCISLVRIPSMFWKITVLISGSLMGLLTILNRFGIDPLRMYPLIVEKQYDEFLATIGQINNVSIYFCFLFPLAAGILLFEKNRILRCLISVTVMLTAMAGLCTNSDSFVAGAAAALLALLYFALQRREYLRNYGFILFCFGIGIILLHLWNSAGSADIVLRELQARIINSLLIPAVLLILSLICFFVSGKAKEKYGIYNSRRVQRIYLLILLLAMIVFIAALVYINKGMSDTSGINHYLLLDDFWGTNRMYIWKRSLSEYARLPLNEKLCGIGSGNFANLLINYYPEEMYLFGYYFVDAHNEFLQFLVENGIIGLAGYLGILIHGLSKCFHHWADGNREDKAIIGIMLIVWIVQGVFNSPTIFVTPLVFYFLGLAEN